MKFLIFVDEAVNIGDISQVVWLVANNLDPMRDCFYQEDENGEKYPVLCFDGTSKSRELDGFLRPWPNIIVMDNDTIRGIDEKWDEMKLGTFLPSPSLNYRSLTANSGAVSRRNEAWD